MSSLTDKLKAAEKPQMASNRCPFGVILDTLPDEDRVSVEEGLAKRLVSVNALVPILRSEGFALTGMTVRAHLREECRCVTH